MSKNKNGFLILDFGSQVTMLIARRLRDLGYYSEIVGYNVSEKKIKSFNPSGIILSGGPNSVYDQGSPTRSADELIQYAPLLGICYGMQMMAHQWGGKVQPGDHREYGLTDIQWNESLHKNLNMKWPSKHKIWMSHGDVVAKIPEGSEELLKTNKHCAGYYGVRHGKMFMGLQYHPEVSHSDYGTEVIDFFAQQCQAEKSWNNQSILKACEDIIKSTVGPDEHVLCALSGGVDSSVVATLLSKVLGRDRVHCVFVNNGLLRYNEFNQVMSAYESIGLNVIGVDAEKEFLSALKGLSDPEKKRKTIGELFIRVFEKTMDGEFHPEDPKIKKLKEIRSKIKFLAQGTLYPDVIESVSSVGGSVTIKSHHNVGGLPDRMKLKLVEPVRWLFKDEVRRLGTEIGLQKDFINRHPFPGPGLSIRLIGEITKEKLDILREADRIYIQALRDHGLYEKIWQAFCVLLPVQTVGVQGDGRTYESVLALRAVTSLDGMTADWFEFESSFLKKVSNEITNKVRGINRVVYDITSKPPATIEWE